jgi:hypothetical protein
MGTARAFSRPVIVALESAKIIGVRSGTEHRLTGIWIVVVNGRGYWDVLLRGSSAGLT